MADEEEVQEEVGEEEAGEEGAAEEGAEEGGEEGAEAGGEGEGEAEAEGEEGEGAGDSMMESGVAESQEVEAEDEEEEKAVAKTPKGGKKGKKDKAGGGAKPKWKWDTKRSNQDDWVISAKAFIKRNSDGEIKYLFGDTIFEGGVHEWGLKVGHSGFLYIGVVDADKFKGWRDTWMHTANHCYCVSYAGGIFYGNGKRLGTAKRIRDGSVVWITVDCVKQTMTLTKGKDKPLCSFKSTPKRAIPWVGIGCANTAYELKF